MITSQEVLVELKKVKWAIDTLFIETRGNKDYIEIDSNIDFKNTADERMLRNEYRKILDHLDTAKHAIEYHSRPIKDTGTLRINSSSGYYELVNPAGQIIHEYHCGHTIEALIHDEYDECDTWVVSRVEHTDGRYYIFNYSKVDMDDLKVRIRE